MQYKFSPNRNYQDLAAGRVIYGSAGMPNFQCGLPKKYSAAVWNTCPRRTALLFMIPCAAAAIC